MDNLISDFMSMGCKDRRDAVIAARVYLELCEVRRYWDVEYHVDHVSQSYLTARETKSDPSSIFVPLPITQTLSLNKMRNYLKLTKGSDSTKLFLVFFSADSTCVYYQVADGLHEPSEVIVKHLQDKKQERLDANIRKNKKLIEQAALCGLPLTVPKASLNENKKKVSDR